MQNKNQQKSSKFRNLCSKFKEWCVLHNVPTLLIPAILLAVFATAAIFVGGALAGWDIKAILTSSTAVLIYVLIGAVAVLGLGYYFIYKRNRW